MPASGQMQGQMQDCQAKQMLTARPTWAFRGKAVLLSNIEALLP